MKIFYLLVVRNDILAYLLPGLEVGKKYRYAPHFPPPTSPPCSSSLIFPPLRLELGPLNPAREFGGAL